MEVTADLEIQDIGGIGESRSSATPTLGVLFSRLFTLVVAPICFFRRASLNFE